MKTLPCLAACFLIICTYGAQAQKVISKEETLFDTIAAQQIIDSVKVLLKNKQFALALVKLDSAENNFRKAESGKKYLGKVLYIQGAIFADSKMIEKSVVKYHQSFDILSQALGKKHLEVAAVSFNLGQCYQRLQVYDSAIYYHHIAYMVRLEKLGKINPLTARSLMNLANNYKDNNQIDSAEVYILSALKSWEALPINDDSKKSIAWLHNALGISLYDKMLYDSAIVHFEKTAAIYEGFTDQYCQGMLGWSYYNIANCASQIDNIYLKKKFAFKSINVRQKLLQPSFFELSKSFYQVGNGFSDEGDFGKAIGFHLKALQILKQDKKMNQDFLADIYNVLGNDHADQDYQTALDFYKKSLAIYESTSGRDSDVSAMILSNISATYLKMKDYNNAIYYGQESVAIRQRISILGSKHILASYWSLGSAYSAKGDISSALDTYFTGIEKSKNIRRPNVSTVTVLHDIGECYRKINNYEKSKEFFLSALKENLYRGNNPNEVLKIEYLIGSLKALSKVFRQQYLDINTDSVSILRNSYHACQEAITALDYQSKIFSSGSKSILTYQAAEVYETALQTNHLLYQLTDSLFYQQESFNFTERSKAALLSEGLRETNALHISGIPDSLLTQEYNLRVAITYYDKRRQELLSDGKNEADTLVLAMAARLFDLNQTCETLRHHFETNYPDYHRLKYDHRTISLSEVQHHLLTSDQSLLEYFVGDSVVYIFAVRPDTFVIREIKKDFPLEAWVEQLRFGLSGYHSLRAGDPLYTPSRYDSTQTAYIIAATNLYQKLIAPVESLLKEEVMVVPDGALGYVPFETLLTGAVPVDRSHYHLYPYWLLKHRVRYTYSATLLQEMVDKQHQPTNTFVAFAPYYDGDTTILKNIDDMGRSRSITRGEVEPLKYSGAEVIAAQRLMGGEVFIDTLATEDQFNKIAGAYGILHFSTHGRADDRLGDYAYLMFSPRKDSLENELLYCRDIYNLSLRANLVVLSACETGVGKLRRGEGIISLARAFAYAGAKSILNSLWSVDDASTQQLIVDFYKGIKAGQTKSEALNEAKRRFLLKPKSDSKYASWRLFRHPYFWSGFILIGDDAPLFAPKH